MQLQRYVLSCLVVLQHTALARLITKSNHLVIAGLQILHVFGFLLLLTSLLLICLRVLGVILPAAPMTQVTREPSRLFLCGLVLALVSGALLFLTGTAHYYFNRAFDTKMTLLLLALLLQFTALRAVVRSGSQSRWAKVCALACLLCWFGVSIAARAIAFV